MKRSFGIWMAFPIVLIVSAFAPLDRIAYAQDCVTTFNQDPRHASLLSGGELRRGAWLQRPENDMVFVMVHGIFSDNRDAWLNTQPPNCTYWPDLVASTDDFEKAGVYMASYYTDVGSRSFDIRQAANTLYTLMTTPVSSELLAPLNFSRIVFVAHSMGGIVVRRMLEKKWASFKGKKIGLVLVASPSLGSGWAKRAASISKLFANDMARELQPDDPVLTEIHTDFQDLIRTDEGKNIEGLELFENTFFKTKDHCFFCDFVRIPLPPVVALQDAGGYFGAGEIIPDTDHSTIAKPKNAEAEIHLRLKRFVKEKLLPAAAIDVAYPGVLEIQGAVPKYGWKAFAPVYRLQLTAHPNGCSTKDLSGITNCQESLQSVDASNPPKVGDRRWLPLADPKKESRLGDADKYDWKELLDDVVAADGYRRVSVVAIDKKPGANGVAVYERDFQLQEFGITASEPWKTASPICAKSHCTFTIEIPQDATISMLVERTVFGKFQTPWQVPADGTTGTQGKIVRYIGQAAKDGKWVQTYQAIPPN